MKAAPFVICTGGDGLKKWLNRIFFLHKVPDIHWPWWKLGLYEIYRIGVLLCAAAVMGYRLLTFAHGQYPWGVYYGYQASPLLLAMNILPVVVVVLLLYGLVGRAWLAFFAGGGAMLLLSLGHYFKLQFRDDPVYFADLLILREAGNMAGNYELFVDERVLSALLCLAAGVVLLLLFVPGKAAGWKRRGAITAAALLSCALLWPTYSDTKLYDSVENFSSLNRWSPTQNYISRGFLYPFIHSITEVVDTAPDGYHEKDAKTLLAAYSDEDIPAEKQVNVIAVMREAYVDFSRFDVPGLDVSGYEGYHQLQAESYSGTLLTNIFAGGTIDSERCFLTGNYRLKDFRGNANSYLWYFRQQGYTVEGSHPYYQWFSTRQNVNSYLGFKSYRFLEGDYDKLTTAVYPEDAILYPQVYQDFVENKASGKPYFSFVLNVESHGPYPTTYYNGEREYLTGDYSAECKYAMNNYMDAIMEGDRQLLQFVEQLRQDSDPVVLVLYSDHLPWMGDSNVYYDEMGLNFNMDTEAGFRSHYSTDYLIWANDAAKAVLGSDFIGEGPTVSPCYLMNLLFEQCGWEGPAYMQAMDELREVFPVVTTNDCYVVDGVFTTAIPEERQELFDRFLYLNHYWRNEFLYK